LIATIPVVNRFTTKKVQCYTIKVSGRAHSEFNDFQLRMTNQLTDKTELAEMLRVIENIVTKWGIPNGIDYGYIKDEDNAHRFVLPLEVQTKANSLFGLRLYCVVLSPTILILLNGDTKTAKWVRDCKRCEPHFDFANKVSQAIERDRTKGLIDIEEDGLYFEEDYTLYI
jgi:hypothetical protein